MTAFINAKSAWEKGNASETKVNTDEFVIKCMCFDRL